MMMTTVRTYLTLLVCITGLLLTNSTSAGNGLSHFTYQGELRQSGVPASGLYDFEFRLMNAAAGGVAVAPVQTFNAVAVDEGLFHTILDFGQSPFDGQSLWLDIRVKETTSSNYTSLSPRQEVTSSPYAIMADQVGFNGVVSGSIVDNSITAADIANQAVGAAEIISSQVQRRINGNCPAGQAIRSVAEDGSVQCQSSSGSANWMQGQSGLWTNQHVSIGADISIGSSSLVITSPFADDYGGMYINVNGSDGQRPFYGYASNGLFRAWTEFNESNDSWNVSIAGSTRFSLLSNGRVGIGETNPERTLHVAGDARIEALAYPENADRAPVYVRANGDLVAGPREHVLSLGPADFGPELDGDPYQRIRDLGHAFLEVGFGGLTAPVHLPDGARVTYVQVWFRDAANANMSFNFRRVPHAVQSLEEIATFNPQFNGSGIHTVSTTNVINNVIDNSQYSYYFRVFASNWAGNLMGIRGVLIRYEL